MVEVRFACIPSVTGVRCILGGVVKYSDEVGISSFSGISQGAHSYSVEPPRGMIFTSGKDIFGRPLYKSGTTYIEWVPIPGEPWPEDQPWIMELNFTEITVEPTIETAIKIVGSIALGMILTMMGFSK